MTLVKSLANPLRELEKYGQSVWLDYIRRSLMTSGELKRLIDEDGLKGLTSNPSIFEKAIAGSTDYAEEISSLEAGDAESVFWKLAVRDIQDAADIMRSVYDESHRRDGYVCLEVSPFLADDTARTIEEAERLWKEIGRDNVMIKVPATPAGLPAIRHLIANGINVNVTLLFSRDVYRQVAETYIEGLEERAAAGGDISGVASVASFFISRIDTAVDDRLTARLKESGPGTEEHARIERLLGKAAIANGKLAYRTYEELFASERWKKLAALGAMTQRVLWASTSTKNPRYADTVYVEELIGADTVNTLPPATFDAFRDHGKPRASLTEDVQEAAAALGEMEKLGISLDEVTAELLEHGVKLFADAFRQLLDTLDKQLKSGAKAAIHRQTYKVPDGLSKAIEAALDDWQAHDKVRRLWARDASLWTGEDEGRWLDWLTIIDDQFAHKERFKSLAEDVRSAGFTHALLLGMGGSSLCPEVMRETFGNLEHFPALHVLDSTNPAQVKSREKSVDLARTLFIVSSKSGTTLEPNIFKQYFWEQASKARNSQDVGDQFIAVTDPGSSLEKLAEAERFRHIFHGVPGIGGRYSALSNFGMVPSAVMGIDVGKFLDNAHEMAHACCPSVPVRENPGVVLGVILGTAATSGRDKATLITSPGIGDLGAWLEQLLAESTGKEGKGIVPVDREQIGPPDVYGDDRLFVYLRLESGVDPEQDKAVAALEKAGHPVVRINVPDIYQLGQEFFRWEIATAVAGSIIGINAFNQPDVEASKVVTRELTSAYEQTGELPAEKPFFEGGGISLFSDEKNTQTLTRSASKDSSLADYLRAHLARAAAGDYVALLAYLEMDAVNEAELQGMRHRIRDAKKLATCLGFGPRFLHSTGQAYKGGPNTGVFLQITSEHAADLPVPGQKYTFGVVQAAQARGDFQVLTDRGRRALRVHLGADVRAGLATLHSALLKALA